MEQSLGRMNAAVQKYSFSCITDLPLKNLARLAVLEFRSLRQVPPTHQTREAVLARPASQQPMHLEAAHEQPSAPSIEAQAAARSVLKAKHLFQAFLRHNKRGPAALCGAIADCRDASQLQTLLEWLAPLLLEEGLASFDLCSCLYALLACLRLPLLDDAQDLLYKLLLALGPLDQAAHAQVLCLVLVNCLLAEPPGV